MRPEQPRLRALGIAAWTLTLGAPAATLSSAATPAPVTAVDSVSLTVSDLDQAVDFYTKVLTFQRVADREVTGEAYEHLFGVFGLRVRSARMRLGDEYLELQEFLVPRGRPVPLDSRSNDLWFQHVAIIVSDMTAAYARLHSFHVEHASTGPQRLPDWNPNAGGIEAFYFRDPDGHNLEVLKFPPNKGLAKWHAHDGRLFLGIDHTAIVVADTDVSLRFYRDLLGLHVSGASENYGTEQEHLNNVFGARLRITALRAEHGPGIEFLEYLAPRTGRPFPPDTQPDDLWYWQINMCSAAPADFESRLLESHAPLLSARTVKLDDAQLGWRAGLLTRDPDGHADLIGEGQQCTRTW